jgi:uncharacterized protein (UPF0335 family)
MVPEETRNRIRTRVEQWQARLEQLRAEGKDVAGQARREHLERLEELRAAVADGIREWHADIDGYDVDPTQTTQREFDEQVGLRELESQINVDLAAWKREGHGVG